MEGTGFLVDILLVLLFAKLAAEVAERVGVPAVVGEIVAGAVAGPSVLGWVHDGHLLATLGEIGVILLLLEVGLEMDVGELGAVGKAAIAVAVTGVVVPFVGGAGAGLALGMTANEAVFVGAALTATSVGITARVFGDLRALASLEARTVLGAAVADDVLGLVILTVVVRLVSSGSVSVVAVGQVVVVAVVFLTVSVVVGLRLVPPVFGAVERWSRSTGTLVALAIAFTFALAKVAGAAKLAPIIGAFVAGICLARSPARRRLVGELGPIGHLFVPVFFFRIGVEAELGQFGHADVLGLAAVLVVAAVAGKLVAALAMGAGRGDRLLVGIGMLPRGEVGLIFATIGLQQGVFGGDVYAALLLVVLVTTLVAPPLLRARVLATRRPSTDDLDGEGLTAGGWLAVVGDRVELTGRPPGRASTAVAVDAALLVDRHRPGEALLEWIDDLPDELMCTDVSQEALARLLARGGARAWRFLVTTGVLRRFAPELDAEIRGRGSDAFDPDPSGARSWVRLEAVHRDGKVPSLVVAVAALVLDVTDGSHDGSAPELARAIAARFGLGPRTVEQIVSVLTATQVLTALSDRLDVTEPAARHLAAAAGDGSNLADVEQLAVAAGDLAPASRCALDELVALTRRTLGEARSVTDTRADPDVLSP